MIDIFAKGHSEVRPEGQNKSWSDAGRSAVVWRLASARPACWSEGVEWVRGSAGNAPEALRERCERRLRACWRHWGRHTLCAPLQLLRRPGCRTAASNQDRCYQDACHQKFLWYWSEVRFRLTLPSTYTRRQTDDGFRACAGPGGPGLRMVFGGDLHHRHHLRRVGKDSSKQRALGSTTSSSPHLLKWAHLRSIPADLTRCRRMPSHAFSLLP